MQQRPRFDELPYCKGNPPFSAWGLYGADDELGTLNMLTPAIVAEAAKEIRTGVRVGLNLPLDFLQPPSHKRSALKHAIIKYARPNHDDSIELNTQVSSQWDGFRHVAMQKERLFYNGVTVDEISGPEAGTRLGTHAWCDAGGISGRGVLLDYCHWAEQHNLPGYDLMSRHAITAENLMAVATAQGVELKQGDILLVRSGFTKGYMSLTTNEKISWSDKTPTDWIGVETSIRTARWLWDTGFSACAGDQPGWEAFPIWQSNEKDGLEELSLHEVMLSGWGMPIGEFFNLERLSKECEKQGRYSFFFSSMPLNVPGGVASPPNAVAIF